MCTKYSSVIGQTVRRVKVLVVSSVAHIMGHRLTVFMLVLMTAWSNILH